MRVLYRCKAAIEKKCSRECFHRYLHKHNIWGVEICSEEHLCNIHWGHNGTINTNCVPVKINR